jgi:hypothetical protein
MADPSIATLEKQLAAIPKLDDSALGAGWTALFGRPPPPGLSRRLLELAAAHHAQAKVYGGLRPSIRRKLINAARQRAAASDRNSEQKQRTGLTPGTRLVRAWHGRTHMVEATERDKLPGPGGPDSGSSAYERSPPLRYLYPQIHRGRSRAGVQFSRCATRGPARTCEDLAPVTGWSLLTPTKKVGGIATTSRNVCSNQPAPPAPAGACRQSSWRLRSCKRSATS